MVATALLLLGCGGSRLRTAEKDGLHFEYSPGAGTLNIWYEPGPGDLDEAIFPSYGFATWVDPDGTKRTLQGGWIDPRIQVRAANWGLWNALVLHKGMTVSFAAQSHARGVLVIQVSDWWNGFGDVFNRWTGRLKMRYIGAWDPICPCVLAKSVAALTERRGPTISPET